MIFGCLLRAAFAIVTSTVAFEWLEKEYLANASLTKLTNSSLDALSLRSFFSCSEAIFTVISVLAGLNPRILVMSSNFAGPTTASPWLRMSFKR